MKQNVIFLLFLGIIISSCNAKIKSNFYNQENFKLSDNKVAFLQLQHKVPDDAKKVGEAKFGDTGFSTDCGLDSNLVKARKLARENGANIVKITKINYPDLWSTCYRMKVEFYFYEGNVEELKQYKLRIN